jgi:L-serine dehydratase
MNVTREAKGEKAIMIIEVDTSHIGEAFEEIKTLPYLDNVNFFI